MWLLKNEFKWISITLICHLLRFKVCHTSKPNVILIVADDMGWNDVSFHGSSQIQTANIDALAYYGMILNRHYVLPVCTPSRASLMTGKYAIRTGLQGPPLQSQAPMALPIEEKILPEYLKELGYKTHLVGKWHLGFYQQRFTPTRRGFDTHFGYYNGWIRYNDSVCESRPYEGYDARRNHEPAADEFQNKYATDVYTDEAIRIIKSHPRENPLFLEISHVAVHAVLNNILQVRDKKENDQKFGYINDERRRLFAGMLDSLDQSVGRVIEALEETHLLENSIVVFMSDNGGPTTDPENTFGSTASNWPLRGVPTPTLLSFPTSGQIKNGLSPFPIHYFQYPTVYMKTSFFEGGVRGVAAIWSPLLKNKNVVSNEFIHITDWLPTFVAAAGGLQEESRKLDGVDQWNYFTGGTSKSNRKEMLVNIDQNEGKSAIIYKDWKLHYCNDTYYPTFADKYAGIPGRNDSEISYNVDAVLNCSTSKILSKYSPTLKNRRVKFEELRRLATIDTDCADRIEAGDKARGKQCRGTRLYNIVEDPCEYRNVEDQHPAVVKFLRRRLQHFWGQAVEMQNFPSDPRANPEFFSGYWSPWLDTNSDNEVQSVWYCATN